MYESDYGCISERRNHSSAYFYYVFRKEKYRFVAYCLFPGLKRPGNKR